jgi:hypothetical protein
MSFNTLPEHYTLDYSQNWLHRIQQFPSLLAHTVKTDSVNGYFKRYSQLESQAMNEITVRHGTTNRQNATSYFRWLNTKKHDIANVLDEWDDKELGVQVSPKGSLVENHGYAYNRLKDRTIIEAAEGNATTGEDHDVLTALPATQRVVVSLNPGGAATDSGLTFAKVARARRIFNDNVLPLGNEAFAIISPEADEALVRDVNEARDRDFSNITPIADGTVNGKMWMGFNWIVHTDLTSATVAGAAGNVTATQCLFYHKSQMVFGDGEKRSSVDILPENSHGVQCRTRCRMGALRMEEKGVVVVETLES